MTKRKKTLSVLIAVMLIAVIAVSFGILKNHKARNGAAAENASGITTEQQAGEEAGGNADAGETDSETNEEPLATLFFASDYQYEEGFDDPSTTLSNLLEAAGADGKVIDRVIMCGDYSNVGKLHDYQVSPDDAIEEIRDIVKRECPGVAAVTSGESDGAVSEKEKGEEPLFVQGNHDMMTDQITPGGLIETDDYIIYILNTEEDFPWKQGKTAGCLAKVRRSSAELKKSFDELIGKGETRPLFIAGHVPLHFTARTSSRHTTGDNLYSSLIFDVVNEAAKSLDIVYLFGHNHSKGWDCYLGGSSVYKAEGDSLLIPRFDEDKINTDEFTRQTLNFTYLNAGYSGYYMNCAPEEYSVDEPDRYSAADGALTGTVFEIYGDRIAVTRYDADGVHVLGHSGEADPYQGGIDEGLITEENYSGKTESPQEIPRK